MYYPSDRIRRLIRLILLLTLNLYAMCSASASFIAVPTSSDSSDLLLSNFSRTRNPKLAVQFGATALGTNNIGSLWEIGDDGQPAHRFTDDTAYANMQVSEWVKLSHREWWIGHGRGSRDAYGGNADAAQLWIDMNADGQTKSSYSPSAYSVEITTSWYELGREFPVRLGKASGTGTLSIKHLSGEDYLSRSVIGTAEGEDFTAMIRTVTADTTNGNVVGSGWSLDGRLQLAYTERWLGQIAVEGLLGRMSWEGLQIEDARAVSPRTFTDPDGFLHDIGGISGTLWHEDRTLRINPYYRMDLIRRGKQNLLLGCAWQSGVKATPNIGIAWPQRTTWMPYTRYYPNQGRLEVGAVGRGWQIRISGDDWITSSPKHAEVGISASAIRF